MHVIKPTIKRVFSCSCLYSRRVIIVKFMSILRSKSYIYKLLSNIQMSIILLNQIDLEDVFFFSFQTVFVFILLYNTVPVLSAADFSSQIK